MIKYTVYTVPSKPTTDFAKAVQQLNTSESRLAIKKLRSRHWLLAVLMAFILFLGFCGADQLLQYLAALPVRTFQVRLAAVIVFILFMTLFVYPVLVRCLHHMRIALDPATHLLLKIMEESNDEDKSDR